jgi:hypothetical protein
MSNFPTLVHREHPTLGHWDQGLNLLLVVGLYVHREAGNMLT